MTNVKQIIVILVLVALIVILNVKSIRNAKEINKEIVLYHVTWCKYCKDTIKVWKEFEKICKEDHPNVTVTDVLCDDNKKCKNLDGYPTIHLIENNNTIEFTKSRTLNNLINFIS